MAKKGETKGCYCDMRGFLSFLVLFLLSKRRMCGKELALELGKRKGQAPSPGTIYPALKALKEQGLISEEKRGKTISYSITKKGLSDLEQAKSSFLKAFSDIIES